MRFSGGILIVIGLISAALHFASMNFIFLNWINNWGFNVAWGIRGGLVLLGIILYFAGKPSDEE
jgi:hypothetical protein